MTAQELRAAAAGWREIHERLHGPLDVQTAETVNEVIAFLVSCAQVPVICVKHVSLACVEPDCLGNHDAAEQAWAMRDSADA